MTVSPVAKYFIMPQRRQSLNTLVILLLCCWSSNKAVGQLVNDSFSWKRVKESKTGTLIVYWFESKPFILEKKPHQLEGIEYDLINGFASFVKQYYDVTLDVKWVEATSFSNIIERV